MITYSEIYIEMTVTFVTIRMNKNKLKIVRYSIFTSVDDEFSKFKHAIDMVVIRV